MATNNALGLPKILLFEYSSWQRLNPLYLLFPKTVGEGEKQKRKHKKMSVWYFFYYIPAKTCSGVLGQRAEPSVFSKGKSTENSIKPSVLH